MSVINTVSYISLNLTWILVMLQFYSQYFTDELPLIVFMLEYFVTINMNPLSKTMKQYTM